MISKDENPGKETIQELFSSLNFALLTWENYEGVVYLYEKNSFKSDIKNIIRKSFSFAPSEVIGAIDITLDIITELEAKGFSIVEKIRVVDRDSDGRTVETTPEENQNRKEEIYTELKKFLQVLRSQLSDLRLYNGRMLATQKKEEIIQSSSGPTHIINIDENYPLPDLIKENVIKLDLYQIAALFHYLKQNNIIQPHNNTSMARILAILTGYSEQNLRTEALGKIHDVIRDKKKNSKLATGDFYNLNKVKKALEEIISEIDKEIQSPRPKSYPK